jgi:hypothetical protein
MTVLSAASVAQKSLHACFFARRTIHLAFNPVSAVSAPTLGAARLPLAGKIKGQRRFFSKSELRMKKKSVAGPLSSQKTRLRILVASSLGSLCSFARQTL